MGEKLIKPYEISVWEEQLTQIEGSNPAEYKFKEQKLAIIGSDTMTGPNKVYDPVFTKKVNGERTLTFSLKYKYFDPYSGNEDVVNPFAALLINERKIKLHYEGEWYEFIIKDHSESSEEYTWTYTCTDAFVLELSKNGYNIEFNSDLNNNLGTAQELAEKTLENTDWQVGNSNVLKQYVEEPIYKAVLKSVSGLNIINTDNGSVANIQANTDIYLFYSYVKNQDGKFVQFIIRDENRQYVIDDKNVITDTNYRIKDELVYRNNGFYKENTLVIEIDEVENLFQANRLAYAQKTTYDPITERTVERFKIGEDGDREVYKYTDYTYTTSNVVMNYIANGDNFNSMEDGTLQGWNPYVDSEDNESIGKLELVTKPELEEGKKLADLSTLSQIEGFLKVNFIGTLTNDYLNTIFNDGIQGNTAFINSISQGDEFVFRWRAGHGDLNALQPVETLGLLVARYTRDTPQRWGRYYYHIDADDVVLDISGIPQELNNIIDGGHIETREGSQFYVIDNVVQTPSTKYLYEDSGNYYYWDGINSIFKDKDSEGSNYLPYLYLTGQALKSVSNSTLTDPTIKYGIFIYTTQVYTETILDEDTQEEVTEILPIYIQDIQFTRCVRDANNQPVIIGNIPTATSKSTDYYYIKPEDGLAAEDIETYTSIEELASSLGIQNDDIIPIYNENSEKNLSISVSQSNCFNILQTIAETFECWVDLVVGHDSDGYITSTNDKPDKYVYLREYAGKDNYAGFKYGINLQSIERTVNSDEIVTKLIVDQSQSDYVDEGYISISNAPSNPTGEEYILNFDYYYNQGLLNREEVESDRKQFITEVSELNSNIKKLEKERIDLEASLTDLGAKRNIYTELIDSAQDAQTQALEDFEYLAKEPYESYMERHNNSIDNSNSSSEDSQEESSAEATDNSLFDEENILDVLGKLYSSSAVINNYSGILSNIDTEYWKIRKELKGSENYSIKIWTGRDNLDSLHIFVELSDYLPGFVFTIGQDSEESTVSKKFFDFTISNNNPVTLSFTAPAGYMIDPSTYIVVEGQIGKIKITSNETYEGVEDKIDDLIEQKKELVNNFMNKYSRYISEGTWNSTDYIDSELYYLDALQVSNTSAQPAISYTINVVEVSQLEGLEYYNFDTGDKTYVEDTEFFGWANKNIGTNESPELILTPAREEVIVSEVEWHLDEPENNVITVQNYKTRFEDLFQRVSAAVQTVQYNEATYAKISSLMDANGTINQDVLVQSLKQIAGQKYNLTSDGSILIDEDRILVRNLTNTQNLVIINSEGIRISSDGGANWATAISGRGINIGTVYTGKLNTDQVIIGSEDNPSFRWDKSGISAYRSDGFVIDGEGNQIPAYDLKTFVRYDQYGLYGIKNSGTFTANSLQDIKDNAHFAVTWDGFFIKNSYTGGGKVQITSDNDFQVINADQTEKIKIGALEWEQNGVTTTTPIPGVAPSLYGIRIKNNAGDVVMQTDDEGNLQITGDISATSGHIGGMVVNSDKLSMNTIVFEPGVGIYSTIRTNNEPVFIISDVNGSATFNNVTARGHIEATTGTLGDLDVIDTITVGAQGAIESSNWSVQNQTGWHIDDSGATFNNANVRGTITALQGDFLGEVRVGPTSQGQDHIIIDGTRALIKSSNYSDGAGYGWMINKDGDAVFNNITARGAIKTAVFEYAEIQAVGGIFIFRPSSTIKGARISGSNLILKVEKPYLFMKASYVLSEDTTVASDKTYYTKTNFGYVEVANPTGNPSESSYYECIITSNSWCKISNYTSNGVDPDSTVQNILLTNGLTHVYQVSNVNTSTSEVTLSGAAAFVDAVKQSGQTDDDVLEGLAGGALIDMGRLDGSSNYGIGVNSSDNTVNLPARAISLFETVIDPNNASGLRVHYNYRGILGTLPELPANSVRQSIYPLYMQGTQGIYTDNMYIGDGDQYIAFYKDNQGDKHLKISAKELVFEYDPNTGEEITWEDKLNDATQGIDGEDAITVHIDSSAGNVFLNKNISTTLTCTVIKGNGTDITNQVTRFTWIKKNADGTVDTSWNRALAGNTITLTEADVTSKAIFICEVEF